LTMGRPRGGVKTFQQLLAESRSVSTEDEYKNAERLHCPLLWDVWKYSIQNGFLVPIKSSKKPVWSYSPILHKGLPAALAKVKTGNTEDVLRFAQVYGHLGWDEFSENKKGNKKGDRLDWFWAHARTVELCFNLIEAIENDSTRGIKKALESHISHQDEIQKGTPSQSILIGIGGKIEPTDLPHKGFSLESGLFLLRTIIISNISEIQKFFVYTRNKKPKFSSSQTGMIEFIYWHLNEAASAGMIGRCENRDCNAFLIKTDPRQRYCAPLFDSPRIQSTCAIRERAKRRQERK